MAFIVGNISDTLLPQDVIDALDEEVPCYGVRFDGENSAGVRTYDAVGLNWTRSSNTVMGTDDFANLAPFNVKECITQYNSSTGQRDLLAYKGDSNWDELVANNTGDRMIEVPCFWYARPSQYEFVVAPQAKLGFKPSPMHYRNGVLHDKIRITKYAINSNYNSLPGYLPITNVVTDTARTNLRAKGLQILDYPTWCMMVQLMLIKYADMNVNSVVGKGMFSGSVATSGSTDNILGLDGSPTILSAEESVLTFGIENFFGNYWKLIDGVYQNGGRLYIQDVQDIVSTPKNMSEFIKNDVIPVGTTLNSTTLYTVNIKSISYDTGFDWMQFPIEYGTPNPTGAIATIATYGLTGLFMGGYSVSSNQSPCSLFDFLASGLIDQSLEAGTILGIEIVPNGNSAIINPVTSFKYNRDIFDTTDGLGLKTEYNIPMSTPTSVTDGVTTKYMSSSDNVDIDKYGTVKEVSVV